MSVPCWNRTRPGWRRDRRVTVSLTLPHTFVADGFYRAGKGLTYRSWTTELAYFAYHLWWTVLSSRVCTGVPVLAYGVGMLCLPPLVDRLGLTGLYPLSAVWVRPARRQCKSGGKDGVSVPPVGTRVSFFERSLLEPNSARLAPGPEGYTKLGRFGHFSQLFN